MIASFRYLSAEAESASGASLQRPRKRARSSNQIVPAPVSRKAKLKVGSVRRYQHANLLLYPVVAAVAR